MILRILGAAGSETTEFSPPGYLLGSDLLLDAGTAASVLSEEEQQKLRWVLISHAHLDHIKDIPFLADNRLMRNSTEPLRLVAPAEVLDTIKRHILNDAIWPDFTRIPTPERPVLQMKPLEVGVETVLGTYRVTAVPVNHVVPAFGYRVAEGARSVVYSGDTGPTDRFWKTVSGADAVMVEVSFPDDMENLAIESGHLTPALLAAGLRAAEDVPGKIFVVHAKPAFRERIRRDLAARGISAQIVSRGQRFEL